MTAVSFLCTAYRTEATVVATLDSVLAQTRDDWQLVLVDNGRSEELVRIVKPYLADPRLRLVRQENARAAGGVNAAATVAEGRFFAVLHTDDLVAPTFLDRLLPVIERDPDLAAVTCDARFLSSYGVRRATYRGPVPARYRSGAPVTLRELVEGWVPYYTGLVRREAWRAVGGYRRDVDAVEDLALWVDLVTSGHTVVSVDEPLAVYREDDGSDSRSARGVEAMERSRERVLTAAVARYGSTTDRVALHDAVTRSRHRRAVVRAGLQLVDGDLPAALESARTALAVRRDLYTRVLVEALRLSPGLVLAAYRAKKQAHRWRRRLAARAR